MASSIALEWNKMVETNRHNVRTEEQTDRDLTERERSNKEGERISWANLDETKRSNLARETENQRSNMAREAQAANELAEQIRSNKRREVLTSQQQKETKRANLADERQKLRELAEKQRAAGVGESQKQQELNLKNKQYHKDALIDYGNFALALPGKVKSIMGIPSMSDAVQVLKFLK